LKLPETRHCAADARLGQVVSGGGAHRDDSIDSPTPCAPVLDANRPDLEVAVVELEDDLV
jgi:hypothetical protein